MGWQRAIPGVVFTDSFLVLEVHKLAYGWGLGSVHTSASPVEPLDVASD